MTRTATLAAVLAIFAASSLTASAADDSHKHHSTSDRVGGPYTLMVDPVTGDKLADVKHPVTRVHEGRELQFANGDSVNKFKHDPSEYLAKVDAMITEQQKPTYPLTTCVVSGEKLGSMGDPIDHVYGNRLVRFCCSGCTKAFNKEPDKYINKVDAAVIAAQKPDYAATTCPVSGDKLGEMGEPVDYVFGTRLVQFCCSHCVKTFEEHPAKYVAKMAAQDNANENDAHGEDRAHSDHRHNH